MYRTIELKFFAHDWVEITMAPMDSAAELRKRIYESIMSIDSVEQREGVV